MACTPNPSKAEIKLQLKQWESKFKDVHGTKPTKTDIQQAPSHIKEAYMLYWKAEKVQPELKISNEVWGEHLNKNNLAKFADETSVSTTKNVDYYSEKLRKHDQEVKNSANSSTTPSVKNVSRKKLLSSHLQPNATQLPATELPVQKSNKSLDDGTTSNLKQFTSEINSVPNSSSYDGNEETCTSEVVPSVGFQIKRERMRVRASNVQCINLLTKCVSPQKTKSSNHFRKYKNIDSSWLERCEVKSDVDQKKSETLNDEPAKLVECEQRSSNWIDKLDKSTLNYENQLDLSINTVDIDSEQNLLKSNLTEIKSSETASKVLTNTVQNVIEKSNSDFEKLVSNNQDTIRHNLAFDNTNLNFDQLKNNEASSYDSQFPVARKISAAKEKHLPSLDILDTSTCFKKTFTVGDVEETQGDDASLRVNEEPKDGDFLQAMSKCDAKKRSNSYDGVDVLASKRQKMEPLQNTFKKSLSASHIPVSNCVADDVMNKKAAALKKKMESGTANSNFVRINLKQKKYHRGKRQFTAAQHKRKQWKFNQRMKYRNGAKFSESADESSGFPSKSKRSVSTLLPIDENEDDEEPSPFLSLEDAADLAYGMKSDPDKNNVVRIYPLPENSSIKALETSVAENGQHEINCSKSECQIDEPEQNDTDFSTDVYSFSNEHHTVIDKQINDVQPSQESQHSGKLQSSIDAVPSLISPTDSDKDLPGWVLKALNKFGYDSFRPAQELAIKRILSGFSTLLILSTGAGKSLCYQLPAYLYAQHHKCITLVISPLVSLMEDQVTGLPACLNAVCVHTNLTPVQKQTSIEAVTSGRAQILLVSPEAVVDSRSGGIGSICQSLPPIAFACIDEIHCLSEWSHNFRPSYLRLCKVLKEKYKVNCILGLTATASQRCASSIAKYLGIHEDDGGTIRGASLPGNLILSSSRDQSRDQALLELLRSDRFSSFDSIIIYCTRREQTERVAQSIRTNFQEYDNLEGSSRKRRLSYSAEAYHAGLTTARRRSVQKQFMSGKIRIVVATVAFGMGIDKQDIRAVIHYNMPKTFESYVQEIGRAGRDGLPAHCHLFLNSEGDDLYELRRHIYANSVDRSVLRKLLRHVFVGCKCNRMFDAEDSSGSSNCMGHEIAVPIENLCQELDMRDENIATLLCYLELSPKHWIKMSSPVYATCKIQCYGGNKQLRVIARKCPPVGVAVALDRMKGVSHDKSTCIEFPVVAVASSMGWNSGIVKRELKNLEWTTSNFQGNSKVKKSGVKVEFSDLAFCLQASGNLSDDELDEILNYLHTRVQQQQELQLKQLQYTFHTLNSVSADCYSECDKNEELILKHSCKLKEMILDYFESMEWATTSYKCDQHTSEQLEGAVRSNIRSFLSTYHEQTFTGRAIARIFSGIASPCFPADVWGRVRRYWRSHLNTDFNLLCKWATEEIVRCK